MSDTPRMPTACELVKCDEYKGGHCLHNGPCKYRDPEDLGEKLAAMTAERDELKRKYGFTYCAYCGEELQIDAPDCLEAVGKHIGVCPKHPMRIVEAERGALAKRVAELERANKRLEDLAYPDGPSGDAGVSAKDYVAMRSRVAALETALRSAINDVDQRYAESENGSALEKRLLEQLTEYEAALSREGGNVAHDEPKAKCFHGKYIADNDCCECRKMMQELLHREPKNPRKG